MYFSSFSVLTPTCICFLDFKICLYIFFLINFIHAYSLKIKFNTFNPLVTFILSSFSFVSLYKPTFKNNFLYPFNLLQLVFSSTTSLKFFLPMSPITPLGLNSVNILYVFFSLKLLSFPSFSDTILLKIFPLRVSFLSLFLSTPLRSCRYSGFCSGPFCVFIIHVLLGHAHLLLRLYLSCVC